MYLSLLANWREFLESKPVWPARSTRRFSGSRRLLLSKEIALRTVVVCIGLSLSVAATAGLTRVTPPDPDRGSTQVEALPVAVDDAALQEMMAQGEQLYTDFCAGCHLENGRGDVGPTLRNAGSLADVPGTYARIMNGGEEMPGFSSVLEPEDAYAVGTYIMNSWGNDYGVMTEEAAEGQ
jgi:mono/diheme cytochrome c family protein